jgi:hypothetical protein
MVAPIKFQYREMRTIPGSQSQWEIEGEIVVHAGYLLAEGNRCEDLDEALFYVQNYVDRV